MLFRAHLRVKPEGEHLIVSGDYELLSRDSTQPLVHEPPEPADTRFQLPPVWSPIMEPPSLPPPKCRARCPRQSAAPTTSAMRTNVSRRTSERGSRSVQDHRAHHQLQAFLQRNTTCRYAHPSQGVSVQRCPDQPSVLPDLSQPMRHSSLYVLQPECVHALNLPNRNREQTMVSYCCGALA